ncbi:MAG: hypothetical protein JWN04_222 [Myxococcaceae bacterium]|nr:hypothetical protein [Myxococcaceae bacterium]
MSARLSLVVVHNSHGRLRLRASSAGYDAARLDELAGQLMELSGVREVRVGGRTGSVLVLYEGDDAGTTLSGIQSLPNIELVSETLHAPMLKLQRALRRAEDELSERTRGRISLGTLTFVMTSVAGLWQTGRGRLLPAGLTLLEYALHAMHREAERERTESLKRG